MSVPRQAAGVTVWVAVRSMSLLGIVAVGEVGGWIADRVRPGESPTGAAVGTGLLVFAALSLTGFLWSLWDGHRRGVIAALATWAGSAVVYAIGWLVWLGASAAYHDQIPLIAGLGLYADNLSFDVLMVLVPAVLGVLLGALGRRRGQQLP